MEAINENLEDLFNAMPWINIQKEIKPQIINFLLETEIQSQNGEIHHWTIRYNDSKEIIGLIGIDRMTNQTGDLNFGYWVKSSCQRKYIASRAIYATLMWLAKSYNAKVLEITVNPENLAGLATCKHILERLNLDQNPFGKTTLDLHGKNIEYYTFLIPLNKIEVDI